MKKTDWLKLDAEVTTTLVASFWRDPVVGCVLGDERGRETWLGIGMELLQELALECGQVRVARTERNAVEGALLVYPPGAYPLRASAVGRCLLRAVARNFRRGLPVRTLRRLMRLMTALDRKHLREPHWYVMTIGVHPERQGRGVSRRLLAPVLKEADAAGVACYLESSSPVNVPIYRNFGFEVLEEYHTGLTGFPPLWLMRRAPCPDKRES